MKRLLCLLLTALMLLSAAACTVQLPAPQTENPTEVPTEEPSEPPTEEPTLQEVPEDWFKSGESAENPPIELTDPVKPIFETDGSIEVGGYADFSDLLSAALLTGTQNRNLSPVSVYLALAMVAESANGDTQTELLSLLGCKTIEELRGVCGAMLETLSIDRNGSTLDIHNSLWMADKIDGETVKFHDEYLNTLAETYRSEANTVEFGSQAASKQIADWINKHTRGKINVKPEALNFNPATLAVLINTIYLKDGWSDAFDPDRTEQGTFFSPDGEIDADYMNRTDRNVTVREGDGWMAYRVYLNCVGRVTFVLPDEGTDLSGLLGSPEAIGALLRSGEDKRCDVSLKIPKFKFQDRMDLTAVLSALGLNLSFTPAADFSGMSDTPCCIDSVLQESYIGVDENGVEAAAYTMIAMRATGFIEPVELPMIAFHLTRPFLYAIESYDGTVLFIGTVTIPGEQ